MVAFILIFSALCYLGLFIWAIWAIRKSRNEEDQ